MKIFRLFIAFTLICFALSPAAHAVVPAPDGGYPNATTAEGQKALFSLTTGAANTAVGWSALLTNAAGSFNTATGAAALLFNIADDNTAFGAAALLFNITGMDNTAVGVAALSNNTMGQYNTATGAFALVLNTTGYFNTANGFQALSSNTEGQFNTADGSGALFSNTTGSENTANGSGALTDNTTGFLNTANGFQALFSNTTGRGNIALGSFAGSNLTTGDNNIVIGAQGVAAESDTIRVGTPTQTNAYIAGIFGATVPTGVGVIVDANGHLGTTTSSARFKEAIKPMDTASEAILALKPVTFRYKRDLDPDGIPQFGLVAEDVAKVNPALVARDARGKVYTVRYEAVNAMLLNEFLKEHCKVEEQSCKIQEQEATITQLKKDFRATVAQLTTRLDGQAAQIQKVGAQLEASKAAPQVVKNTD